MSHGMVVRIVTAYGIELMPLKSTSASRGIGILISGFKGFFATHGLIVCADTAPRHARLTDFGCRRPGSHLTNVNLPSHAGR